MFSVYFETYGCQMNVADSAALAEVLAQEGYAAVDSPERADLVVVNTCSVRAHAEQRARGRIAELAAVKCKHGLDQEIWVIGCMAERLGDSLRREIAGVDRVIGALAIPSLGEHIGDYLRRRDSSQTCRVAPSGVSAFVPIMRGCDNFCAYCVVPYVRGREQSIPARDIEDTVRRLADRGVREVTLLGQNVNSYRDVVAGADFPGLLGRLHVIDGVDRIRFTTSHPRDFTEALIGTLADLPKLCRHVHLPVQSGSTRVLGLMNRGYTADDYRRTVDRLRRAMVEIDITTDVMAGFPGETESDFGETMALLRDVRFTTAFMFAYSPRPGTAAATMPDQVTAQVAKERLRAVVELQTAITKQRYDAMPGRRVRVLFTERQAKRDRLWMGQDYGCKRALLACDRDLAGTILEVTVRGSSGMTMVCSEETACVR